ncbi:MAG: glutamine--fructose-6-phosphate transaminase (isomerizing) [Candidatus Dependentiae bacterium]|nr:glutamine--fructose-6-phosphate transaminase (isomerizing) [Candidatus Dependentiae bacterium]
MCGIVGYVGGRLSRPLVLDGLSRLEYRGYDSAGFVCQGAERGVFSCVKAVGGIGNLVTELMRVPVDGHVGVGHTRWATHGASTEQNAHPHFNGDRSVAVVHNGIVENYAEIKARLLRAGHTFYSETDTEVIAHLFGVLLLREGSLERAVFALVDELEGAFACVIMARDFPDGLIAVRRRSPLCIGVGEGEVFVASDVAAFSGQVKRVVHLPDGTGAFIHRDSTRYFTFDGQIFEPVVHEIDPTWSVVSRDGFEHYMLKEIYEQTRVLHDTAAFCRGMSDETWRRTGLAGIEHTIKAIHFVACGTSAHAAEIAAFFFERINNIPATSSLASEFRHRVVRVQSGDLYCFLSQSGETADTLEALRHVRVLGGRCLAIVNVPESSMVREADGYLLTQARREIAVASTKSFTAQISLLYWLSHQLATGRAAAENASGHVALYDLIRLADLFEETMERYRPEIESRWAPFYAAFKQFIFLGRAESYPLAREAALKLKEVAYSFVDCYPSGELKHGPIALIDAETPVFIFSSLDEHVYRKLLTGAQEVKARKGHIVVFAFEGQDELVALADTAIVVPVVAPLLGSLILTGVMQLFVYHIAKQRGCPIDKPRHLAKSVTVE